MGAKFFPLLLLLMLATVHLHGQQPQVMNYQAVVRNASGQPLASGTPVSCKFLIHDGSAGGPVVFQEATTLTTNQFGLITHGIGSLADLSAVNWGLGEKWLQILIDPLGGNN